MVRIERQTIPIDSIAEKLRGDILGNQANLGRIIDQAVRDIGSERVGVVVRSLGVTADQVRKALALTETILTREAR